MDTNKTYQKMQCFVHALLKGYNLKASNIKFILQRVIEDIFMKEPNVIYINAPAYIIGGVVGHIEDFQSVFDIGGPLPYSTYLFLGNFTGATGTSLNTILLLFLYKYLYKENFYVIQGRNEDLLKSLKVGEKEKNAIPICSVNKCFLLNQELMHSYELIDAEEIWPLFVSVFNILPVSAIVGKIYFCTDSHFLLPDNQNLSIEVIRNIDRSSSMKGKTLLTKNINPFLRENKFGFLISGLNAYKSEISKNPVHYEIFSSPHSVNLDQNCYIIEINEHTILKKIKMKPCQTDLDIIYSIDQTQMFS